MTPQPNPDVLPQETYIGRTALRVNDLEKMTGFYQDVVGLSVLGRSDTNSVLGVDDIPLLLLKSDEDALERPRSSAGLFHIAFRVPLREALGDALTRIRNQWQLTGASDHGVSEALYTTDPEGNGIEIYRDFPRDEWPIADDGSVQMSTEPLGLDRIEAAARGETQVPAETDIGHVHLEVSSLDAFKDLYVDILGFEVQTIGPNSLFVSAGGYHHHMGANTWNQRTDPISGRGLAWLEIILPETQAFDALRERLVGSRYLVTETTDGISVTDSDQIEVRFRVET